MIAYIEGTLMKKDEDRVVILANQVGYEIMLPAFVMDTMRSVKLGDPVRFHIHYQQTERQPKPVLIGFHLEAERDFFQQFISVEDIGAMKAVKALTLPIRDIARAIENGNVTRLKQLKGVGQRTAQKIVATLQGRLEKFVLIREPDEPEPEVIENFTEQVYEVLTQQLGHKPADARRMIQQALERNSGIQTPEALFDEVYRGEIFE